MDTTRIAALFILCASLAGACGCTRNGGPEGQDGEAGPVTGQWHLESWGMLTQEQADVYVSFGEDGTFDLYQRVYTPYYEHYDGSYTQQDGCISGTYSDGTAWNAAYTVTVSDDKTRLTLTNTANSDDAAVYRAETIPEEIISGALSLKSRSGNGGFRAL
ncbi:MAG: hypothetical protein IAB80_09360 [Bacteroidetes bacterium]|uniref:Lipocalin-like domain-containing protein n=1 Tax=Candidatus Cryptobacteroides excrementipullorum TaxID=2840761 RepID=A0A9D9IVT9_9BACT|nr:hypothetical protein [Candidatus Cryptobacteroides excrementipullorum]